MSEKIVVIPHIDGTRSFFLFCDFRTLTLSSDKLAIVQLVQYSPVIYIYQCLYITKIEIINNMGDKNSGNSSY